jgi:3-oxoacyl-[acyl-carrier protein] reductase
VNRLDGKVALISGAARGIGAETARLMVEAGAKVAIGDVLDERGGETVRAISGSDNGAIYLHLDVTREDQWEAAIAATVSRFGGLDILVNNAGGARPGQFGTLTDEDWHEDIEVKLFSQIRCTRVALPHLRRSEAPRVININAVYGRYPDPAFLASSVNRASCLSLTKALSMELGREGILVNSVNIGLVETPQWQNIHRRRAPDVPASEFFGQLAAAEVPLGRFGQPDEVAGLVTFLASHRASYIAGASIDVAGGMGKFL